MRKIYGCIVFGISILFLFQTTAFSQTEATGQSANIKDKENFVSVSLAQKIAKDFAEEHFKIKVSLGEPILGYWPTGELSAYIFPVRLSDEPFPGRDFVLNELKVKRNMLERLSSGKEQISGEEFNKKFTKLQEERYGLGKYATVVVSARKDLAPIRQLSNTLPRVITIFDEAMKKAKEELKSDNVQAGRLFYVGALDQLLEFKSEKDTICIDLFGFRILRPEEVSKISISLRPPSQRIKDEWKRLEQKR